MVFTTWNMYELTMLALTIWREARGEIKEARIAVAHTVLNRVENPGWWGRDIISVVTKKWQYSSLTDTNDRQLTTWPQPGDVVFAECLDIAKAVIDGTHSCPLKGIDSYYDDSLKGDKIPKWAKENPKAFVGKIGKLNFYNLDKDIEK